MKLKNLIFILFFSALNINCAQQEQGELIHQNDWRPLYLYFSGVVTGTCSYVLHSAHKICLDLHVGLSPENVQSKNLLCQEINNNEIFLGAVSISSFLGAVYYRCRNNRARDQIEPENP